MTERPHTDAVYRVHHSRSLSALHPALEQSPGEGPREASETLQGMLRHLGHPDANYAFVMRHPKPEHGRSTPVYSEGDPGVALHPQHWTNEYLAHEAAHLMENHATNRAINTPIDDHGNHGPGFQGHLVKLLNHLSPPTRDDPGAGDEFPEHLAYHSGKTAKTASGHPTRESVHNIVHNYAFADGDSWDDVKANYDTSHPSQRRLRQDIKDNGIREPIKIDYDQSPPEVVDGHTRLMHAESLGHTHVPVEHSTFADAHYYASLRTASGWNFEHFQSSEPGLHRVFGQPPGGEPRQHNLMYQTKPGNKLKFDDFTVDRLRTKGGDEAVNRLQQAALDHHPGHTLHTPEDDKPAEPEKPKRRVYYHGTHVEDVTHVLPADHHGGGTNFDRGTTSSAHAYATPSKDSAWDYAERAAEKHGGRPRVYQVRPIGGHQHVEEDPHFDANGHNRGNNLDDVRSKKGFEVVREMAWNKSLGSHEDWEPDGERHR